MDATSLRNPASNRRAFTLVELLVVIVIIGILAGLTTAVAFKVRVAAKVHSVVSEMAQLELALESYKEKFQEYPPDFSDPAAVNRHITRAFPKYRGDAIADLKQLGVPIDSMDPGAALVFWLGGIPESANSKKLTGFSKDVRNPFTRDVPGNRSRYKPFFEFNTERLRYVDGVLRYFPDTSATSAPYVYFRAHKGGYNGQEWNAPEKYAPGGSVRPLLDTNVPVSGGFDWVNPHTYQIITGGITDGKIGEGYDYPLGETYDDLRFDDITNFAGKTLEDKMP